MLVFLNSYHRCFWHSAVLQLVVKPYAKIYAARTSRVSEIYTVRLRILLCTQCNIIVVSASYRVGTRCISVNSTNNTRHFAALVLRTP